MACLQTGREGSSCSIWEEEGAHHMPEAQSHQPHFLATGSTMAIQCPLCRTVRINGFFTTKQRILFRNDCCAQAHCMQFPSRMVVASRKNDKVPIAPPIRLLLVNNNPIFWLLTSPRVNQGKNYERQFQNNSLSQPCFPLTGIQNPQLSED